jgi:hypothetical protein
MDPKGIPKSREALMDIKDDQMEAGENFTPTKAWLTELKETLPLETVTRLLQHYSIIIHNISFLESSHNVRATMSLPYA